MSATRYSRRHDPADGDWCEVVDPYGEPRRCVYDRHADAWRPENDPSRAYNGGRFLVLDEPPARFEPVLRAVRGLSASIPSGLRPVVGLAHGHAFDNAHVLASAADIQTLAVGPAAEGGEYPFPDFYAVRYVRGDVGRQDVRGGVAPLHAVDLEDAERTATAVARSISADYGFPIRVAGCVAVVIEGRLPYNTSVAATFVTAVAERDGWFRRASRPAGSAPIPARLRFLVLRRDGYRCQLCGATADDGARLHIDHKLARSKGGTNDEANLWTLCAPCNLGKSNLSL